MLKLIDIEDYRLVNINKAWFKGKIYIDKRAKIIPFQMVILERFISEVASKSYLNRKIKLDFHILITGDPENAEFSVDLFAFIDDVVIYDDQDVFNNPFSAMHWGINRIFCSLYKVYEQPADNNMPMPADNSLERAMGDPMDDLLPGEFVTKYEKQEKVH